MRLRRPHIIGIVLIVLALVVAIGVQVSGIGKGSIAGFGLKTVTGVVGSEKAAFFADPKVQSVFEKHGYRVEVTKSGSWRMADLDGLTSNDFAFPASEVAADHIVTSHSNAVVSTHKPFFSPMAIATFEPVVQLLAQNGMASQNADGRWEIDMAALLSTIDAGTRWNQLPGAAGVYESPRSVLITSTDIRTSNSAGMYLALASNVLNGDQVVATRAEADALLPQLTKLFVSQGYAGASSTAPFDDYLSQGMGAVPMVMIYEGQYLEEQVKSNSRIGAGMVLAYPTPNIFSVHTGVTFSEDGRAVMELLETDPELAQLLAEHGFRPQGQNAAAFEQHLVDANLTSYPATSSFVNVAQEPAYETLDYLLSRIGEAYSLSGAPATTPEESLPGPTDHGGQP